MKKTFFIAIGLLISILANAQFYKVDLDATVTEDYKKIKEGTKVKISGLNIGVDIYNMSKNKYSIVLNGDTIEYNSRLVQTLKFEHNSIQDLWDEKIICNVIKQLESKGIQEELRTEMEEEALNYISKQKLYSAEFNDPYLENYIYSLISKIAPQTLIDSRPGNVNLLILEDPSMNAGMYSNGTLVINTGLISALHTEDELVAILAHEIAHFVLDHNIQNVNAAVTRKKRAEFWAGLATGLTAVAEGVAASKNEYYIPGAATVGMAVLSTSIAHQVIDRLGMKYNIAQEDEADKIAIQALEILGYNKNALASALNRMSNIMKEERSHVMYFQSYTHPSLIERIQDAGTPQDLSDSKFEKIISFAVTSTARMKFEDRRFRQVLPLVKQNINNKVATSEDYILKAHSLLALHNDPENNIRALDMINMAKSLEPSNINIYKAEILANLRLEKYSIAQELLARYIENLNEMELTLKDIESDKSWEVAKSFITNERNWAKRMTIKITVLE